MIQNLTLGQCEKSKIRQITRPHLAIQQKLSALENIRVWNYEKRPQVICLDLESNTYILNDYDDY